MKRILLCCLIPLLSGYCLFGQKLSGVVNDQSGTPIPFATTVLLTQDSTVVTGGVCDELGKFIIENIGHGDYLLEVSCLGFENRVLHVNVPTQQDLGTVVMTESASHIGAAVIRSEMIRRRADGYVLSPAGSPVVRGRNTLQLLQYAPGVWTSDDGITINGKSGTRIMVNDRELNMSGTELTAYLESIDAEQIQSIEVIPEAGARYDASATGGILRITLKRQTVAGMTGYLSYRMSFQKDNSPASYNPQFNINYRKNRLSLYSTLNFNKNNGFENSSEYTRYLQGDQREVFFKGKLRSNTPSYSGKFGTVYEITDRQSVGLDFDISYYNAEMTNNTTGDTWTNAADFGLISKYKSGQEAMGYNFSFNYRIRTDDRGSNLMLIADYMKNKSENNEVSSSIEIPESGPWTKNSTIAVRDTPTDYYTARVDYTQVVNEKLSLDFGAKYAYTDMDTKLDYEINDGSGWQPDTDRTDHYLYREGITAGYVNGTAALGKWSIVAGLRYEHTSLRPRSIVNPGMARNQNYGDLFPTVNIAYFLNREKGHMLSASYRRGIRRPGFSELNPYRIQLSNYTYVIGNPDMKPTYNDGYTLTGVFANMYSLTLGISDQKDAVSQIIVGDENNPELLYYQHANIDRVLTYYASLSAPANITKWWRMSFDGTYLYIKNKLGNYNLNGGTFTGRLNNVFSLPANANIELSYEYISGAVQGNLKAKSMESLNFTLSKSFFNNKMVATLFANNLTDNGKWSIRAEMQSPGEFYKYLRNHQSYRARTFGFYVRWNFRAGKEVRVQKVVAGNEEERSR